jgi:hypothetical protein
MAAGVQRFRQQSVQLRGRQCRQPGQAGAQAGELAVRRGRGWDKREEIFTPVQGRVWDRGPSQQFEGLDLRLGGRRRQRKTDQLGLFQLRGDQPTGGDFAGGSESGVIEDQGLPQDQIEQRIRQRTGVVLRLDVGDRGLQQPLNVISGNAAPQIGVGVERRSLR